MTTPISIFYAGLLGAFFLYLTARVILGRGQAKVSLGDGDDKHLLQRIRAHANFAEYVPFALLLLLLAELNQVTELILHGAGVLLLFGRGLHAYGVTTHFGPSWQRIAGAALTFTAMIALIAACLYRFYQ